MRNDSDWDSLPLVSDDDLVILGDVPDRPRVFLPTRKSSRTFRRDFFSTNIVRCHEAIDIELKQFKKFHKQDKNVRDAVIRRNKVELKKMIESREKMIKKREMEEIDSDSSPYFEEVDKKWTTDWNQHLFRIQNAIDGGHFNYCAKKSKYPTVSRNRSSLVSKLFDDTISRMSENFRKLRKCTSKSDKNGKKKKKKSNEKKKVQKSKPNYVCDVCEKEYQLEFYFKKHKALHSKQGGGGSVSKSKKTNLRKAGRKR